MLFEHFVVLETHRLINYAEKPFRVFYWRSLAGAEVDMVLDTGDTVWAIEIKSTRVVRSSNLKGLISFARDYERARPVCVSVSDTAYMAGGIPVIPWRWLFGPAYLDLVPRLESS